MSEKKQVAVILGPSSIGKSSIACKLAPGIGGQIVSADAFQVYRHINLGTGKPPEEQLKNIKHYLIDRLEPNERFDAAKFRRMALDAIAEIIQNEKKPLVVGGTNLYLKVLCQGLSPAPGRNDAIRFRLEEEAKGREGDYLYRKLLPVDAETAARLHPNDRQRIIRALEVYEQTGIPLSVYQRLSAKGEEEYSFFKIGVIKSREELYLSCEQRIAMMFQRGWVEEVRNLLAKGLSRDLPAFQALGYREIIDYLSGQKTMEEARELIKRNTRRFIKRQLTWLRREKDVTWIKISSGESEEETAGRVMKIFRREGFVKDHG